MSEQDGPDYGVWRLAGAVVGLGAFAAALAAPAFRDAEGALTGAFVVPLGLAVGGCLIAGVAKRTGLAFVLWSALLLVGQAASLQLIEAGSGIGYQHYVPWAGLLRPGSAPWAAIFAVQAILVLIGLGRSLPGLISRLSGRPAPWRVAAVLAVALVTGAAASREIAFYGAELALAFLVQVVALGNVLLIAATVPDSVRSALADRLNRFFVTGDSASRSFWRVDGFVLAAACWTVAITALFGLVVYQWHPHVPDEVVYLLHSKYLAAGHLELPLPPVPEAFDVDLMTYEATRWYSPTPPGWPMVLAAGAWLGVPWLVNPVLTGICVVTAHILVRSLYSERVARMTTLLLSVSPWFLFLGMSLMTHQLTLTAGLVAAVAASRLRHDGSERLDGGSRASAAEGPAGRPRLRLRGMLACATVSGIGIGVLALIRPLEGLIAALLLGPWVLLGGPARRRVVPVLVMAVASIAVGALTLPYNAHYTGDPTYFPIMAYTDALYGPGSNSLGFGPDRGLPFGGLDPFPGHGPADAAVNTALNLFQVNVELLGWMTGSLLPIALLLVSRSLRRQDIWMLAVVLAVAGAHALYWFSGGPDFGARYWYLILVPSLVLAARAVDVAGSAFRDPLDSVRPRLAMLVLCLATATVFVPWRAADKYFHYRGMRSDVRQVIDRAGSGDLVLVRGARMPDYMSAVPYGSLLPDDGRPVVAWDRDEALRLRVLLEYSDRRVWIVAGPTVTGSGWSLVAGPVPATSLISELTGER